jgi:hypothetical protein
MRKMIFVHVPKTGGTTMKHILKNIYGQGFRSDKTEYSNMRQVLRGDKKKPSPYNYKKGFDKFSCVIGHFPLSKYEWLKNDRLFVTWLRDPIERMISMFTKRKEMGFMRGMPDFMDIDIFEYSRRMPRSYEIYLDRPLDMLDFIGFTETYNKSLKEMESMLGKKAGRFKRQNVTTWDKLIYSDDEKEQLREILKSDYNIYNKAREICGKVKI